MSSEIIYRDEANEIKELKGWVLIYGRRKVGKTFLIKNFLNYDVYFMVGRDGKILAEKFVLSEINSLKDFSRAVSDLLKRDKIVVIDEFQRLPESFLEEISTIHPKGKVIFCGSSMRIIKRIFGDRSPLLGLVAEYKLGLLRPRNILRELSKVLDSNQAIELAPYFSDVWTTSFFKPRRNSLEAIYHLLKHCKLTVPALIGEIFTEEERELTKIYEAILRLMGAGEWDYRRIAAILANRGLVAKADSSLVLPYIKNLIGMGLVESLPLYSSKKKMYKLASPIMEAFYYLTDRYDFEETDVSFSEVKPTLEKLRSLAMQNWVADCFAEIYQGRKEYFVTPEKEIDFVLTVRRKPMVVGEVKWGKYDQKDIENFKEKTKHLRVKKIFMTKEKTGVRNEEVRIVDGGDLMSMVKHGSSI